MYIFIYNLPSPLDAGVIGGHPVVVLIVGLPAFDQYSTIT